MRNASPTEQDGKKKGSLVTVWDAFLDPEVSLAPKLVVVATLLYILVPFDLLLDFLPVGLTDDLMAALLGFRSLAGVLAQHRRNEARRRQDGPGGKGPIIDI